MDCSPPPEILPLTTEFYDTAKGAEENSANEAHVVDSPAETEIHEIQIPHLDPANQIQDSLIELETPPEQNEITHSEKENQSDQICSSNFPKQFSDEIQKLEDQYDSHSSNEESESPQQESQTIKEKTEPAKSHNDSLLNQITNERTYGFPIEFWEENSKNLLEFIESSSSFKPMGKLSKHMLSSFVKGKSFTVAVLCKNEGNVTIPKLGEHIQWLLSDLRGNIQSLLLAPTQIPFEFSK